MAVSGEHLREREAKNLIELAPRDIHGVARREMQLSWLGLSARLAHLRSPRPGSVECTQSRCGGIEHLSTEAIAGRGAFR